MRRILFIRVLIAVALVALVGAVWSMRPPKPEHWVVYYSDVFPPEKFAPFDLIVFDRDGHPPLAPLKAQRKTLLGYISFGEAEPNRAGFQHFKDAHLLLDNDPPSKSPPIIDARKAEWRAYVLNDAIPKLLAQGFDGIMIDTVDVIINLERNKRDYYDGLQAATVSLIKAIRRQYPTIKIMLNRGFEIIPEVGGDIDMVLAESTYTGWNVAANEPALLSVPQQQYYLDMFNSARARFPRLKIYTLDYWPPSDTGNVGTIYERQREKGFIPYVAMYGSQEITPEPDVQNKAKPAESP